MGHVLELILSIFDFVHFMARQGFDTSITEVASKYAAKSLALVYDWYSQAIADTPTGRVSNLRVVSTLM